MTTRKFFSSIRQNHPIWLLAFAALGLAVTFADPTVTAKRDVYRYVFIVDITQSMNTRDYRVAGMPPGRLSFVKETLRQSLQKIPCGSDIGIGIFSAKDSLLLFEPIEVCEHFAVLDDVLAHIDWRMAWSGDSNIDRGIYSGMQALKRMEPSGHMIFLTDGQQTIDELHRPPLAGNYGKVRGYIVGVGGLQPVPVPELDGDNRIMGYWRNNDERLSGNYRTRDDSPYLSKLFDTELRALAGETGLQYHRLESPEQFKQLLLNPAFAESRRVATDIRWILACAALLLLLIAYCPSKTKGTW